MILEAAKFSRQLNWLGFAAAATVVAQLYAALAGQLRAFYCKCAARRNIGCLDGQPTVLPPRRSARYEVGLLRSIASVDAQSH